jgi:hypothetical protein
MSAKAKPGTRVLRTLQRDDRGLIKTIIEQELPAGDPRGDIEHHNQHFVSPEGLDTRLKQDFDAVGQVTGQHLGKLHARIRKLEREMEQMLSFKSILLEAARAKGRK